MGLGPSRIARMPDITGGGHRDIISTALPDAVRRLGDNAGKGVVGAVTTGSEEPSGVVTIAYFVDSGTLVGTSDTAEMDFTLPDEGVWLLNGVVAVQGTAEVGSNRTPVVGVNLVYTNPSFGSVAERRLQFGTADPGGSRTVDIFGHKEITVVYGGGFPNQVDLTLSVTTDGITGSPADYDLTVFLTMTATRLGDTRS